MRPDWRITIDGEDLAARRLVELVVEDAPAVRADTCRLRIDGRPPFDLPRRGGRIAVEVGFEGRLDDLGEYVVDAIAWETPPAICALTATGALTDSLTAPRTVGWIDQTMGDIVAAVAERAGLEPDVDADLAPVRLQAVWQVAQSDIDLLTTLATRWDDTTAAVSGGRLIVAPRQRHAERRAAGLEPAIILPGDVRRRSIHRPPRSKYVAVVAHWWDQAAGASTPVRVGEAQGEPVYTLGEVFREEAAARNAAETQLRTLQRDVATGVLELSVGRPDIVADQPLDLPDTDWSYGAGRWSARRVVHRLTARDGLTTRIEVETETDPWTRAPALPRPDVVPPAPGALVPAGAGGRRAPRMEHVVRQVAAAHPGALRDSCQDHGGTWDFMDLVVEALRKTDDGARWGYNLKRGGPSLSPDAIAWYRGLDLRDAPGSTDVAIVDIIANHCGSNPRPAWIDQTSATARAGSVGRWQRSR